MGMEKFRFGNLPIPPADYSPEHLRQAFRILEIYFNQLDSNTPLEAEYFHGLGYKLTNPFIAASDSTSQYATADDTPTVVAWNTLEGGFGWDLNSPGSATALYAGNYRITYSLQFANTDNAVHDAVVWLRVNGDDVANSTTFFSVPARKSAGVPSYICGYSEVTFPVYVDDEIELVWATAKAYSTTGPVDGVYIEAIAAQTAPPSAYDRPAVPSAIGSITFVSAIPRI